MVFFFSSSSSYQRKITLHSGNISKPNWADIKTGDSKMTGDYRVLKFRGSSADKKHLMRFKSENAIFKFLRRIVEEA